MVRLTLSLITAFLASTYLAFPILPDTTTTEDELVALYGPMSTWKEIKLVDAFPGALIDGAPADPNVVYARIPPTIANKTPNIAPRDDSSAQECYNGDSSLLWTSQYQMRSVLAHFCTDASNHGISNGAEYGGTYTKYLSASGSWADFTDSYGVVTPWVVRITGSLILPHPLLSCFVSCTPTTPYILPRKGNCSSSALKTLLERK